MLIESEKSKFPTEESVVEAFSKMDSWLYVINNATGLMPPEARHSLEHCKAYLTVMLLYETIKQSGRDLSKYNEALTKV